MFYLLGPAGVGKSAVAQTAGEDYMAQNEALIADGHFIKPENRYLIAAFFFSRPNHRDNAVNVIPTIVAQLIDQIPDYAHLMTECFAADSGILDKPLHFQFKYLLVDPFRILHARKPFIHPILIILDGLDECSSKEAQCEFINLINEHVRLRTHSPLVWLVCSRPEWHLKKLLSDGNDFGIHCRRDELSVDDDEARSDALLVLRDELAQIQHRFRDRVPQDWPGEAAINALAEGCGNLFIVIITVTRFIGDEKIGKPVARLDSCLSCMIAMTQPSAGSRAENVNPFRALDLLYTQILLAIPSEELPDVMAIVCLRILNPHNSLSVSLHANVLSHNSETFYALLSGMHSILQVPPLEFAEEYGIQFYHASFGDYLRDRSRAEAFSQAWITAHCDVTTKSLHWYNALISTECALDGMILQHLLTVVMRLLYLSLN
jgi:hypothetical protein